MCFRAHDATSTRPRAISAQVPGSGTGATGSDGPSEDAHLSADEPGVAAGGAKIGGGICIRPSSGGKNVNTGGFTPGTGSTVGAGAE